MQNKNKEHDKKFSFYSLIGSIYLRLLSLLLSLVLTEPRSLSIGMSKSLRGKTIIITGATNGIGKAAAKALACRGASIILACRDMKRAENVAQEIRNISSNQDVYARYLDLDKLDSVRKFASTVGKCHILINNAGLLVDKLTLQHENGIELTMLTNHLGPFLLTNLLIPIMRKTVGSDKTEGRIIVVGSRLEKTARPEENWLTLGPKPYNIMLAYANSKLCNLLMTFELSRKLRLADDSSLVCNVMTPGMVRTNLASFAPWWQRALYYPISYLFLRNPEKGAETIVYMAESEELSGISGKYFYDKKELQPSTNARSLQLASDVWKSSCKLVGIKDD